MREALCLAALLTVCWLNPGGAQAAPARFFQFQEKQHSTTPAANQPPQVRIFRPPYPYPCPYPPLTDAAVVTAGNTILIKVAAQDPDGFIAQVKLFANTNLIGVFTNSPYAAVWQVPLNNTPVQGSLFWKLTAIATDDSGAASTSDPISIYGSSTTPTSPVLEIISPADGVMLSEPGAFEIKAELLVSDPNDRIPFEFWIGTNLVGYLNPNLSV